MDGVRCYAVRRLNPFLGVTQVVELDGARALSTDGHNWELQLLAERRGSWGSLNRGQSSLAYCRHGLWSAAEGLATLPVPPSLDPQVAARRTADLLVALQANLPRLPFGLADRLECWLFDAAPSRRPLALLASQEPGKPLPERPPRRWQAQPQAGEGRHAALEAWVVRQAIPGPVWIERQPDGGGLVVSPAGPTPLGIREFPAEAFPELLLAEPEEPAERGLHQTYVAALSARLLMLPLSDATRQRLEASAADRADEVARFFGLYPRVLDRPALVSLRVQARLQAAGRE